MPWDMDNPPKPAVNWDGEAKQKCIEAANAALAENGDEEQAIFACIRAAGKETTGSLAMKVIDAGERIIEGYAATWDEDFEGEAFEKTAFTRHLDRFMKRATLLWRHGKDSRFGLSPIGKILQTKVDDVGLWVRAKVYKGDNLADAAWNLIQQGVNTFSVGALQEFVKKNGNRILEWPLVEISVEPFAANPNARFEIVKSMQVDFAKAVGCDPSELDSAEREHEGAETPKDASGAGATTGAADTAAVDDSTTRQDDKEITTMPDEMKTKDAPQLDMKALEEMIGKAVSASVGKTVDAALEAKAAADKATADKAAADKKAFDEAVATEVKAQLSKVVVNKLIFPNAEATKDRANFTMRGPYDDCDPAQLALGYMVMRSAGKSIPNEYYRALHGLVGKQVQSGKLATKSIAHPNGINGLDQGVTFADKYDRMVAQAVLATKADELMGSDVSTAGDEWIPVYYSRELIPLIRNETKVAGLFRQVEVEGESLVIPIQTGSVTWYKTAQADDTAESAYDNAYITARVSKAATSNITLTPGKLSAITMWTGELDAQSLVPMLPFLQSEFVTSGREALDEIVISGDETTGATNISDYGNAAIDTSWRLLLLDGLRHHAEVDSSAANNRDAGTLTSEDFLATKKLMGTNGVYALDPMKLVWVFDAGVYWKILSLGESLTLDKMGPGFTWQSGIIERVFGSTVIPSAQFGATDSSGHIHNTTGNNTLGAFLCVRPDQGIIGFGRRMKVETQRIARSDSFEIVAHMAFDFDLATYEAVAQSYNVTV